MTISTDEAPGALDQWIVLLAEAVGFTEGDMIPVVISRREEGNAYRLAIAGPQGRITLTVEPNEGAQERLRTAMMDEMKRRMQ